MFKTIIASFLLSAIIVVMPLCADETAPEVSARQAAEVADIDQLYQLGGAAFTSADYSQALEIAGKLIRLVPEDYRGYWLRANTRGEGSNEFEEAIADLKQVNHLAPRFADAWGLNGWYLIMLGRFNEARMPCEKAQALDPASYAFNVNLGHTYLLQGDSDSAIQWYRRSLLLIPGGQVLNSGPLADFDLFISHGWSVDASKKARAWFVKGWTEWREINALNQQISTAYNDGRYQEALPMAEEALRRIQAILGDDNLLVASCLNNLAMILNAIGRYDESEPLYRETLAINRKVLSAGHPNIAKSLNNLASLLDKTGRYDEAELLYREALSIDRKTFPNGDSNIATDLNNLAMLLDDTGRYVEAEPLYREALAINRKVLPEEHPDIATILSNLGALLDNTGRYDEAETLYREALSIHRKTFPNGHPSIATDLNNLAMLLETTGRYDEAEPLNREALVIWRKVLPDGHPDIATSLNNLALLLFTTGRYDEAERLYREALAIRSNALPEGHPGIASSLINLAALLRTTGRYDEAEPLYREALAINRNALPEGHPDIAISLNNLASFLDAIGRYNEAEPLYREALAINHKALREGHPDIAASINNLAGLLQKAGRYDEAESLYWEALAIWRKALPEGHPDIAASINNLASLFDATGRYGEAEPLYREALQIAEQGGEPEHLFVVQGNLSVFFFEQQQPALAIFYGKQAVNTLQSLRRNMQSAKREIQKTFVKNNEGYYKHLAELLMDQGRLPEAEQVLDMLKEQEYFDFIGRDPEAEVTLSRIDYAAQEQAQHERYVEASQNLAALGKELQELERINEQVRADAEQQRIKALQAELEQAQQAYTAVIDEINTAFAQITDSNRQRELALKQIDTGRTGLITELGELSGSGVALIHYLVLDDVLYILVTTPKVQLAHRVAVGAATLDDEIRTLRQALQHAGVDPRPAAKVLYEHLIQPIAEDLAGADAHTLMLSLDGKLRYLPFAALYDGDHYLVERYALSVYTPAASDKLKDEPKPAAWTLAGFGVSQAQGEFGPLQAVPRELEEIVKRDDADTDGVVRGTIHLDDGFTESALKSSLWDGYPVLHLASHFKFQPRTANNPGTEDDSFLLLGDGEHLTLGQLRKGGYNFGKVDLLTLSACQTALGGEDAQGQEVESLGVTAQKREARGVLATLWSVADPSTGPFMQDFYRKLMAEHLTKAEALRQVQLAFIRGEIGPQGKTAGTRGEVGCLKCDKESANAPFSVVADYSHPYYWAPFILMGNWL